MRMARLLVAVFVILLALPRVVAQETQTHNTPERPTINFSNLKVKLTLTEMDGTKIVSSLPYTMSINLTDVPGQRGYLRSGIRVPVSTNSKTGEQSMTYVDVGTNIDCELQKGHGAVFLDQSQGNYILSISIEKSSLYVPTRGADGSIRGKQWESGDQPPGKEPALLEFRGNFDVSVHEGQPTEITVAADPITGHVLKAEVTASLVK
jgi:hypothetical protein